MKIVNTLAWILVIVGALNWGLVGAFQFDLVAYLFNGDLAMVARVVYILVGLSAVYLVVASKGACCTKTTVA